MLRKMMYRKIVVASSLLLVILMLYLIPTNKEEYCTFLPELIKSIGIEDLI